MGGAGFVRYLPATGRSSHPIKVIVVDVDIININFITFIILLLLVAVVGGGSSSGIIAVAVTAVVSDIIVIVAGAIVTAVDIFAAVIVIVDIITIVVVVLLSGQLEKLDQTTPQWHCPWCADGMPTLWIDHTGAGGIDTRTSCP